jgi:hypothetical protein
MKFDEIALLVMGLLLSQAGWFLLHNRGYDSWRFGYVDFGNFHWVVGALFLGVGLVAIVHPLHKLYRDRWKR